MEDKKEIIEEKKQASNEKKKNSNKLIIFVSVGILLIILGYNLLKLNNEEVTNDLPKLLTVEEATTTINELLLKVMLIYEYPKETIASESSDLKLGKFSTVKVNEEKYTIYLEKIYTREGIASFEKTKFSSQSFVTKNDNGIFLIENIPENKRFSTYNFRLIDINIRLDKINATVVFSKATMSETQELAYYVSSSPIVIVKEGNHWLIKELNYSNF